MFELRLGGWFLCSNIGFQHGMYDMGSFYNFHVGMFRAIRNLMAAEAAGFEDAGSASAQSQDAAFRDEQRVLYQDSLPNMFYVKTQAEKDALKGIDSALSVANPLTRTVETPSYSVYNAATSAELSPDVISKMSACESATLESLITGQNPSQTLRCGWLYKPGQSGALVNRGVLGTKDGPVFSTCLLYTSPSPRDGLLSRMPSSA